MTEVPHFLVSVDYSKVNSIEPSDFPFGIPCCDFFALDKDNEIPKNFFFEVNLDSLTKEQRTLAVNAFLNKLICNENQEMFPALLIPVDVAEKVIHPNGNEAPLEVMRQAWIVSNHVSKLGDLEIKLNGEVGHIVLMGLQQALFIDVEPRKSLNPLFFDLAIHLIKQLSLGNEPLKEYFMTPFPCEYMNSARASLFPE